MLRKIYLYRVYKADCEKIFWCKLQVVNFKQWAFQYFLQGEHAQWPWNILHKEGHHYASRRKVRDPKQCHNRTLKCSRHQFYKLNVCTVHWAVLCNAGWFPSKVTPPSTKMEDSYSEANGIMTKMDLFLFVAWNCQPQCESWETQKGRSECHVFLERLESSIFL